LDDVVAAEWVLDAEAATATEWFEVGANLDIGHQAEEMKDRP